MAIVRGPLHSIAASGQIGKCMVFQDHPQRQIVRLYIPTVTQNSRNQLRAWSAFEVAGSVTKACRARNWTYPTENINWIESWDRIATTGNVWASELSGAMIGKNLSNFNDTFTEFEALPLQLRVNWANTGQQTAGVSNIRALDGRFYSAGFVLFIAEKATAAAGIGSAFNPLIPRAIG